jgi:hypothetical protein
MSRSSTVIINRAYADLERLAERSTKSSQLLRNAYSAAYSGEREHRAAGARFTAGRARYRESAAVAARYFVCKWVAENAVAPHTWLEATQVRPDCLYGRALACLLTTHNSSEFTRWKTEHGSRVEALDYVRDIVGGPVG